MKINRVAFHLASVTSTAITDTSMAFQWKWKRLPAKSTQRKTILAGTPIGVTLHRRMKVRAPRQNTADLAAVNSSPCGSKSREVIYERAPTTEDSTLIQSCVAGEGKGSSSKHSQYPNESVNASPVSAKT